MPKYSAFDTQKLIVKLNSEEISVKESFEILKFLEEAKELCVANAGLKIDKFKIFLKEQKTLLLKEAVEQGDEETGLALLKSVNLEDASTTRLKGKKTIASYLKDAEKEFYNSLKESLNSKAKQPQEKFEEFGFGEDVSEKPLEKKSSEEEFGFGGSQTFKAQNPDAKKVLDNSKLRFPPK